MSSVIAVATGTDMVVWLALVWAAFRVSDTVATLSVAVADVVGRRIKIRRTRRKWAAFRAAHSDLFQE